jgi:hypothetical protein
VTLHVALNGKPLFKGSIGTVPGSLSIYIRHGLWWRTRIRIAFADIHGAEMREVVLG